MKQPVVRVRQTLTAFVPPSRNFIWPKPSGSVSVNMMFGMIRMKSAQALVFSARMFGRPMNVWLGGDSFISWDGGAPQ